MIEYKKMTARDLKVLFSSFMEEKYGFIPSFSVGIYPFFSLPILIKFDDDSDTFDDFFKKFQYDVLSVPDNEFLNGDEYDYGDNLLHLIYAHPIISYEFIGANAGDDVYFSEENEDCTLLISIDNSKTINFLSPSEVDQLIADFD